jgi:hypothetical protein
MEYLSPLNSLADALTAAAIEEIRSGVEALADLAEPDINGDWWRQYSDWYI